MSLSMVWQLIFPTLLELQQSAISDTSPGIWYIPKKVCGPQQEAHLKMYESISQEYILSQALMKVL